MKIYILFSDKRVEEAVRKCEGEENGRMKLIADSNTLFRFLLNSSRIEDTYILRKLVYIWTVGPL